MVRSIYKGTEYMTQKKSNQDTYKEITKLRSDIFLQEKNLSFTQKRLNHFLHRN